MSSETEQGAPENAQDLTIFVQNLLEQMVRAADLRDVSILRV
jgi:hypothetical protein